MNPIINEFGRAAGSRTGMIILIVLIALIVVGTYGFMGSYSPSNPSAETNTVSGYYSNGTYFTFVTYTYNGYGNPLEGKTVNVQINNTNYQLTSNAAGYANITEPLSLINIQEIIEVNGAYFFHTIHPYFNGSYSIETVNEKSNSLENDIMIFYAGKDPSPPVSIYYNYSAVISTISVPNANIFYKNISNFHIDFVSISGAKSGYYTIKVSSASSSDNSIFSYTIYQVSLVNLPPVKELTDEFMNSVSGDAGFIVSILAVFYGYYSFGRDRVDGTIESTLVRPVTKTGLLSSRYAASVMIFGIAAIIGSFLSSLLVFHYSGYFLSTGAVLLLSFSIVVSAAGIIGLIYFLSNFLRTVGSLMGVGIFLFIFFSIIWNIALLFIPGIFYPAGSVAYGRLGMALNFLNPFSYISMAVGVYTKSIFISFYEYTASSIGLTYTTFFAVSLIWILVPYALAIMVWNRRD